MDFCSLIDQSVFEAILDPLSPQTFLDAYWSKSPLYLPGKRDKFSTLFSYEKLWDCLRVLKSKPSSDTVKNFSVRASFDRGQTHLAAQPEDAIHLLGAGATICVCGVDLADRSLSRIVEQLRKETHFLGGLDFRAYASPDGQGFDMHFDARVATTLQLDGSKEWTFSKEPATEWPHQQRTLAELQRVGDTENGIRYRHPSECKFETVLLEPGDMLCLPAGTWHAAAARGHSLALNLAFDPRGGFFSTFGPALKQIMSVHPGWRAPVPPAYLHDGGRKDAPQAVQAFFYDRIGELISALELMRESPDILNEAWRKLNERDSSPSDSQALGIGDHQLAKNL